MKGTSTAETVGYILIVTFLIVVIFILLQEFLPSVFEGSACKTKQVSDINGLVSDAIGTRASQTYKDFQVQTCVEHIDFNLPQANCFEYTNVRSGTTTTDHGCFEILFVGQTQGNCKDAVKMVDGTDNTIFCNDHKGTFYPLPGGQEAIQISTPAGGKLLPKVQYTAVVKPFELDFIGKQIQ